MLSLVLEVSERNGVTVLGASGDLDLGSAPQLRELAVRRLTGGDRVLVIDLTGVEFLDSTGLGTLVAILKRARTLGAALHLVVTRDRVRRVFELTGLTNVFTIHADLDAAVAEGRAEGDEAATPP